ncbi:questin oxidase family protein [Shewanella waksmanii]|uniref:questin oxidase family protein n=1 Tax=Shewanella waksmanii TaxID=213783 RepID=UPI003736B92F
MEDSSVLQQLLTQSGKYHPLYGGGLATHLPMELTALSKLGAPDSLLERTFAGNISDLISIEEISSYEPVISFEAHLGDSDSYCHYLRYFQLQLAAHSIEHVLQSHLPTLIAGVAASAFHGLIRLAYAIEAHNRNEIAVALAFWSAEYQPFVTVETESDESLAQILTRLSALSDGYEFSPGIIVDRMSEIAERLRVNKSLIYPLALDLPSLKSFALKLFYLQDDFTLLHTVTGCHAFSIILPYIEDENTALKQLWKAILVAYLSTGLPFKDAEVDEGNNRLEFDFIINQAINSGDSHVIKLVYSCYQECQQTPSILYWQVAHRAAFGELG